MQQRVQTAKKINFKKVNKLFVNHEEPQQLPEGYSVENLTWNQGAHLINLSNTAATAAFTNSTADTRGMSK